MTVAYTDIPTATAYLATRLSMFSMPWDMATDADRMAALCTATEMIDRLNFLGCKTDEVQVLQFPRDGDTTVPEEIVRATVLCAVILLDGFDIEIELENLNMVSQGYANVRSSFDRSVKPAHIINGIPSSEAWRYLTPFLRNPNEIEINRIS
jgi:Putative DnaT-like ssDNA binding protein